MYSNSKNYAAAQRGRYSTFIDDLMIWQKLLMWRIVLLMVMDDRCLWNPGGGRWG